MGHALIPATRPAEKVATAQVISRTEVLAAPLRVAAPGSAALSVLTTLRSKAAQPRAAIPALDKMAPSRRAMAVVVVFTVSVLLP